MNIQKFLFSFTLIKHTNKLQTGELKLAILKMLSACVVKQPGFIELFMMDDDYNCLDFVMRHMPPDVQVSKLTLVLFSIQRFIHSRFNEIYCFISVTPLFRFCDYCLFISVNNVMLQTHGFSFQSYLFFYFSDSLLTVLLTLP